MEAFNLATVRTQRDKSIACNTYSQLRKTYESYRQYKVVLLTPTWTNAQQSIPRIYLDCDGTKLPSEEPPDQGIIGTEKHVLRSFTLYGRFKCVDSVQYTTQSMVTG